MKKPLLQKLIQEIAMFDMDAACKLHMRKDNEDYEDKDNLRFVIDWNGTKEGFDYWHDVNDKLEARRKNYHPHRDLMIEYANDKSVVMQNYYEQQWCDISEPAFFVDQKYRKKPKVTKKFIEYRIYLDKENQIKTSYGTNQLQLNLKEWLGDWQKVEIEVEEND